MTRKGKLQASITFWLIGGFLAWLGDTMIPSTGWAGGIVFLIGMGIFLIPLAYFVLNLVLPGPGGVNAELVTRARKTPSVKQAVQRATFEDQQQAQRQYVAQYNALLEDKEEKRTRGGSKGTRKPL
jgi:hypothetical protein